MFKTVNRGETVMSSLMNFLQEQANGGTTEGTFEKIASIIVEKESQLEKIASHAKGEGAFIGKGYLNMMSKISAAVVAGAELSGMNTNLPPSAAVTSPKGGIEVPGDGPGQADTLSTVKPNDGSQYNNDLFAAKVEQRKVQAGLADISNDGIHTLSGSPQGTSAIMAISHS